LVVTTLDSVDPAGILALNRWNPPFATFCGLIKKGVVLGSWMRIKSKRSHCSPAFTTASVTVLVGSYTAIALGESAGDEVGRVVKKQFHINSALMTLNSSKVACQEAQLESELGVIGKLHAKAVLAPPVVPV